MTFWIIKSFLTGSLNVVVNDQSLKGHMINAGIPQDFLLGHTLVLLYINDVPKNILVKDTTVERSPAQNLVDQDLEAYFFWPNHGDSLEEGLAC